MVEKRLSDLEKLQRTSEKIKYAKQLERTSGESVDSRLQKVYDGRLAIMNVAASNRTGRHFDSHIFLSEIERKYNLHGVLRVDLTPEDYDLDQKIFNILGIDLQSLPSIMPLYVERSLFDMVNRFKAELSYKKQPRSVFVDPNNQEKYPHMIIALYGVLGGRENLYDEPLEELFEEERQYLLGTQVYELMISQPDEKEMRGVSILRYDILKGRFEHSGALELGAYDKEHDAKQGMALIFGQNLGLTTRFAYCKQKDIVGNGF